MQRKHVLMSFHRVPLLNFPPLLLISASSPLAPSSPFPLCYPFAFRFSSSFQSCSSFFSVSSSPFLVHIVLSSITIIVMMILIITFLNCFSTCSYSVCFCVMTNTVFAPSILVVDAIVVIFVVMFIGLVVIVADAVVSSLSSSYLSLSSPCRLPSSRR